VIAPTAALERLEHALAEGEVEAEVMLTGGAVMSLVFDAQPQTRRASALLGDRARFDEAVDAVAREYGLPPDWLSTATRQLVAVEGTLGGGYDSMSLRVFSPLPDYVLAMKCAELAGTSEDDGKVAEADLRYLLRLTGVRTAKDALERVHTYFGSRQLPDDLAERLRDLL
jgi:glycerol-3-phosphate dehydrogenase